MTVRPAFVFLREGGESNNAAVARCAREALAAGPMGNTLRGEDYESFLDGAYGNGKGVRTIATSCAVFVGGCLVHARVQETRNPPKRPAITTWLAVPGFTGSWVPVAELEPQAGDVFYICSDRGKMGDYEWTTWQGAANGHVGILTEGSGWEWWTAEGGGSPGGTTCRMSPAPKDIRALSRKLRGVWRPDLMGAK